MGGARDGPWRKGMVMATIIRTLKDPSKPAYKIIWQDDRDGGRIQVNICHAGDASLIFGLALQNVARKGIRQLTADEAAAHWAAQAALTVGAGI